jgi:hypothetical protein
LLQPHLGMNRHVTALICVLLLRALTSPPASAQGLSAPALKAAFLHNFTRFAEWPADAISPEASLGLCVIDDPDVVDALTSLARDRTPGDRLLDVRSVKLDGSLRGCHLLYASGLDHRGCLALLDAVRGLPVLTIADNQEYAVLGGAVNFLLEHDKIRFTINVTSTARARVTISSKLLALAKIIKEPTPR